MRTASISSSNSHWNTNYCPTIPQSQQSHEGQQSQTFLTASFKVPTFRLWVWVHAKVTPLLTIAQFSAVVLSRPIWHVQRCNNLFLKQKPFTNCLTELVHACIGVCARACVRVRLKAPQTQSFCSDLSILSLLFHSLHSSQTKRRESENVEELSCVDKMPKLKHCQLSSLI